MSDFNPVTLSFILYESLGAWLWFLLASGVVLLAGIAFGLLRLRRASRSARHPLLIALGAGLATAVAFTFLVPIWTLADPGALTGPIDYAFAFLFALVPGGIVGSAVFVLAAMRCAGRAGTA
jgi:hypothetical protein